MNFTSKDATVSENIRHMMLRRGISITDLAEILKTSRQNLNGKLKRNNFCEYDLHDIANALGYEVMISFIEKEG